MEHWSLVTQIVLLNIFAHKESIVGLSLKVFSRVSHICVPGHADSYLLIMNHTCSTMQGTSVNLQQYSLAANASIT